MDIIKRFAYTFVLILIILIPGCQDVAVKGMQEESISKSPTKPAKEDTILGPQSQQALGEQHVLVVAVRFPDVQPRLSLQQIRKRAVKDLDRYVKEQSYGLTWVKADFRGWVDLPDPISEYKISPIIYEFIYHRSRIIKLIEDTMTAIERKVDFSNYQHMLIIPGAGARSEKGYGAPCYNANPGKLLAKDKRTGHQYATFESKGGKKFNGGVFVGIQYAALGMFAHDFFHSLGGIYKGRKLVP